MKPLGTAWPLLLLLLAAAGCGSAEHGPNVILIVMDTTRADRCSLNGYERPTTPALEALAGEGLNFRNTWSPAGWTGPAHASIFTGLLPERHGFLRGNREYLAPDATTLAERFRRAGYGTACLTNNSVISAEYGLDQGFDRYVPLYVAREKVYPTALETHRLAIDWISAQRAKDKRFFLFINHMEPHHPYTPPVEFREKFRNPDTDPAESARVASFPMEVIREHDFGVRRRTLPEIAVMSDLYDAEIACLDQAIGSFVERLRAEGVLDETLLIITSDHGENLGDHDLLGHMFSLHRTIRHVPLLIRLPGGKRGGQVIDEVVRLEDLFPTTLEVCGLSVPAGLDGKSLLGEVRDRRAPAGMGPPVSFVEGVYRLYGGGFDMAPFKLSYRALFDGRLHWIQRSDGLVQAFDIRDDPGESSPLDTVHPETGEALRNPLAAPAK